MKDADRGGVKGSWCQRKCDSHTWEMGKAWGVQASENNKKRNLSPVWKEEARGSQSHGYILKNLMHKQTVEPCGEHRANYSFAFY